MEATLAPGFENLGVLDMLNASALNSVFTLSVTLNVRKRLRFTFHNPGPISVLRPEVPKRTPVGCRNAKGSNHDLLAPISPGIRTWPDTTWSAVWALTGAFSSVPEAPTVNGVPVYAMKVPLVCQPPSRCDVKPFDAHRLPLPNGASYTNPIVN